MPYRRENFGVRDNLLGEWDFYFGFTLPEGNDVSGETVSCRIENPNRVVINDTAEVSDLRYVHHKIKSTELNIVGYWWYWFFIGTKERYGPFGIKVHDVPAVTV